MFISNTFMIVVVVLMSATVGLYFLGVFQDVFRGSLFRKMDYKERAAELLNLYKRRRNNQGRSTDVKRDLMD